MTWPKAVASEVICMHPDEWAHTDFTHGRSGTTVVDWCEGCEIVMKIEVWLR